LAELVDGAVEEGVGTIAAGLELGLELVAVGHEAIDGGDDAFLFGDRGRIEANVFNLL
jgi:hypothetical protein